MRFNNMEIDKRKNPLVKYNQPKEKIYSEELVVNKDIIDTAKLHTALKLHSELVMIGNIYRLKEKRLSAIIWKLPSNTLTKYLSLT